MCLAYFSGQGINENGEKPVERDQGDINEVLLKVGVDVRELLSHQAPHYSLHSTGKHNTPTVP